MKHQLLDGDATKPVASGIKFIIHVCNDVGAWGSGFVMSLSKRWPEPEAKYRSLSHWQLGKTQFVTVDHDIVVCNMIAQHGIGNGVNIRYDALAECLGRIEELTKRIKDVSVHLPYRMGADRAGGDWETVIKLVESTISCPIYVWNYQTSTATA